MNVWQTVHHAIETNSTLLVQVAVMVICVARRVKAKPPIPGKTLFISFSGC